jgi:putative ABC transport system permease protein
MLKLINITKEYDSGDSVVRALKGVNIEFRQNEFVSVLGQSGCGKTTLLNIIGGLDRYTSGDLIINGRSTAEYNDHDWDTYRNHSIGFVFQSYNLIPHQTVLSNVELALTLSGVSKKERKERAVKALQTVGLGDQINKKPNQMSGGQMQRVAIARALINDPEILLADEPTGALDSETSEQIMQLLKEVASDRLVIMVTHNPELADRYSTRIIKLLDGSVVGDSNPYDGEANEEKPKFAEEAPKRKAKDKGTSMSFFTALSLSLNNLLTKKGRTFMTSFAGSIGIIGIALILSLSSGFQAYINKVQEETLSSYPISITAESVDMSELLNTLIKNEEEKANREDGKVYANTDMYDMMEAYMNPEIKTNNLEKFKAWIQDPSNNIGEYVTAIQYGYATPLKAYVHDLSSGVLPANDYMALFEGMATDGTTQMMSGMSGGSSIKIFEEMLQGDSGEPISDMLYSQYELVGDNMKWPENKNEVVLVVDKNNEIAETYLYTLGLLDRSKIEDLMLGMMTGETTKDNFAENTKQAWDFDDLLGLKFRLLLPTDIYMGIDTDGDGVNDKWEDKSDDESYMKLKLGSAEELTVVGIIRPKVGVVASVMTGAVGYRADLTDWYIEKIAESEVVKYQLSHENTDVLSGLEFKTAGHKEPTAVEKKALFNEWVETLNIKEKAELYVKIATTPDDVTLATMLSEALKGYSDRTAKEELITKVYIEQSGMTEEQVKSLIADMNDENIDTMTEEILTAFVSKQYAENIGANLAVMDDNMKSATLMGMLATLDDVGTAVLYDSFMPDSYSDSSLKANLEKFGYTVKSKPSSINIYCATFEDKDKVASLIEKYNKSAEEDDVISYTDYVALMMSSISTIIDVISYVLIAFVSISLVVSSIMIGIITYISVLERTKEIGILRSIGASKRDISRVFNAETLIVGFVAGLIGILATLLLNIPINIIIEHFADIKGVSALPVIGGIGLVAISMFLTFIAGLIPAKVAARKDPVVALRSE